MISPTEPLNKSVGRDDPYWIQLLALCPALAVATNTRDAAGLAVAAFCVMMTSTVTISVIRRWVPDAVRLPAFLLTIGFCATTATLLMQAFAFDLYERIAIFAQIVVAHCVILAHTGYVARETLGRTLRHSVTMALACSAGLIVLGAIREFVGHALPLASLPPGTFLIAGLSIAIGNAWIHRT